MTLQETLLANTTLEFFDNVFFQRNLEINDSFEQNYLNLRKLEGRLYSDNEVKLLPYFNGSPNLSAEWKIRKYSANRLIQHLQSKSHNKLLLEVGCGNGWLTNLISTTLAVQVVGLDLNKTELTQGSKVFLQNQNIAFIYGDIFTVAFQGELFDTIILASVIQYFSDLTQLISQLFKLLKYNGEIHVLDSPLYETLSQQKQAKIRTDRYYEKIGQHSPDLTYQHHLWSSLETFKLNLLHDPRTLSSKLSRKFTSTTSPFPHIVIHKSN